MSENVYLWCHFDVLTLLLEYKLKCNDFLRKISTDRVQVSGTRDLSFDRHSIHVFNIRVFIHIYKFHFLGSMSGALHNTILL